MLTDDSMQQQTNFFCTSLNLYPESKPTSSPNQQPAAAFRLSTSPPRSCWGSSLSEPAAPVAAALAGHHQLWAEPETLNAPAVGLNLPAGELPPRSPEGRRTLQPAAASGSRRARWRRRGSWCRAAGCRGSCGPSSLWENAVCTHAGQCFSCGTRINKLFTCDM